MPHRTIRTFSLVAATALVITGCGGSEATEAHTGPPPARVRLFDAMPQAERSAKRTGAKGDAEPSMRSHAFEFDDATALETTWLATPRGRSKLEWIDDGLTIADGTLRIGPGIEQDYTRAVLVVPVPGRAIVEITGRVRTEGHPAAEPSSYREALRVYQHLGGEVTDPSTERDEDGERTRRRLLERVARRRVGDEPWATVSTEVITQVEARSLEVHLLHRTGDSADVVTSFDDLTVRVTPLDEADYLERLVSRYRPRDGQEASTPWRLRVELRGQVRDCTLVATDTALSIPVRVPDAETAPRLRFAVGALPQTARERGDAARLVVAFESGGVTTRLKSVELDPKNDREHRSWHEITVDLAEVAGQDGALRFAVSDVDDEPDELDALLVATPRIEPTAEAPTAPNVLLIGVDTLRTDRMSAFGYERDTTPNLRSLADEGVRFTATRSPAPWTLPSFSSMLTSLYPSAHGAGRGGHDEWEAIDPTTVSVAEVLARNGWETAGIVANMLISPRYGLDQGFETYEASWRMESVEAHAPLVREFVESHTQTPWLLFWHIMDPHLPYTTDDERRLAFTDAEYDGKFGAQNRGGPAVPFQALDPRPGRRWYAHEGPPPPPDLTPADERFVSDYYDAEIREVDDGIGSVLEALRASGQWDRTIVVFVADHGEGLGDHGHYHHGYTLYDDQVRIPWIMRVPGGEKGLRIERPVSSVDLVPTLLGAIGVPPHEAMQGTDRLAANAPEVDATFIEYPTYDSSAQKAWVEGRFKYLHDPLFHTAALYDVVADPAESKDVSAEHPDVVARAREALDAFRLEHVRAGRYHLRLRGEKGQRLRLKITTNDLFDANFLTRPAVDENHFTMDNGRTALELDTELDDGRLELRFWCRGSPIGVEASLDGRPIDGLRVSDTGDEWRMPTHVERSSIPVLAAEALGWPDVGRARLWLEEGASEPLPVVNTPEEAERLRELGYGH